MKYIKRFTKHEDYESYIASEGYVCPNVSFCNDVENEVHCNGCHDYSKDYLTFVATESGTFKLSGNSVNYSLDNGETWTALASSTDSPTVNAGNKILWKATLTPTSYYGIGIFISTANFTVEGNPMSLLFGDDFKNKTDLTGKDCAFKYLFSGCTKLTSAENVALPATTLADFCYYGMFIYCTSIISVPSKLPATTLVRGCYEYMFEGCTSLSSVPMDLLQSTTLAPSCYYAMFLNCSGLTTAPQLPATILADRCYGEMFKGCSGLTAAPELLSTTLEPYCYYAMFQRCYSMTQVQDTLPATTVPEFCYQNMFTSCSSLTKAPQLPATTLTKYCYAYMFSNCSGLTTAPVLSAATLAESCYHTMFLNCNNLSSLTCLATDISATNCTTDWVGGFAASGTFTKAASMTSWTSGKNGIPNGWTVVDA